jgi:predicted nucleic acid-binding protein
MKGKNKLLKILVDTSVWLDLARDYREQPVIAALEDLIEANQIQLIIPEIVIEEFHRNKARVTDETQRGLQSHFRLVREAVNRFADDASKSETLKALNEVDHAIVTKGDALNDSIARIETLLKSSPAVPATAVIKERVTERAIANKAPYHRGRNSVGDAIIIETYAAVVTSGTDIRALCRLSGSCGAENAGRGARPRSMWNSGRAIEYSIEKHGGGDLL